MSNIETWKTFIPTKKQKRIKAVKDACEIIGIIALHIIFIGVIWIFMIIGLAI